MAPDLFHGMSGLLQCISYLTLKKDTNSCMKTNPCLNILQKYSQAGAYFFQEENIFYIPILCSLLELHTEAVRASTRLVAGYCIWCPCLKEKQTNKPNTMHSYLPATLDTVANTNSAFLVLSKPQHILQEQGSIFLLDFYRGQRTKISSLHQVIASGQTVKEYKTQEFNQIIAAVRRCMHNACKHGIWISSSRKIHIPSSEDHKQLMQYFL